jgi:hypothetical protein
MTQPATPAPRPGGPPAPDTEALQTRASGGSRPGYARPRMRQPTTPVRHTGGPGYRGPTDAGTEDSRPG